MTIKVMGETYRDEAELIENIDKLETQASEMGEGTPARKDLLEHVNRLRAALIDPNSTDAAASTEGKRSAEPVEEEVPLCPFCEQPILQPLDIRPDPRVVRCPDCDGLGETYTGARTRENAFRTCPTCQGNGFMDKDSLIPLQSTITQNNGVAPAPLWPNARWDSERSVWLPPVGTDEPWQGARWNELVGGYA